MSEIVEPIGFEWMRPRKGVKQWELDLEYVAVQTNQGTLILCRHEKVRFEDGSGTFRTVAVKPEELRRLK